MKKESFRDYAHKFAEWMADYWEGIEKYPVLPDRDPGDIKKEIPVSPPEKEETLDEIFNDFKEYIVPGMTHWQHPSFFAYFNANNSEPSILAEMLTATMGAQCMIWLTSPAATELEERVMDWLRDMIGLPDIFKGVIQDTGSTSTLIALVTARERISEHKINDQGFDSNKYTVYCSEQAHSSIDKSVRIAGFGLNQLRKIPVDENFAILPEKLEEQMKKDLSDGFVPTCIIAALGTTSTLGVDPIEPLGQLAKKYNVWLHVDAAYAGSALIIEDYRWMIKGVEYVDSFFFNPHKWLFTNFDCSAYFVKDTRALIRTFAVEPEYLKTGDDPNVINYRDWGLQLGRRFRALKLWFVIRYYGVNNLKMMIKKHISLGAWLKEQIKNSDDFEIMAPVNLNLVCFRFHPRGTNDPGKLNILNERLLKVLNTTGKLFLSHTVLNGQFVLRIVPGQTRVEKKHIKAAWDLIQKKAFELKY